jgi:lipopolysaccharide/colanic/teichoic acid biosynthesis glycosyltransferase
MEGSTFFHTYSPPVEASVIPDALQQCLPFLLSEKERTLLKLQEYSPDKQKTISLLDVSFFTETRMNDVRRINKFLEQVNESLEKNHLFIGSFETYRARRHRIGFYKVPVLKYAWIASEFIFLRLFPKVPILKSVYFAATDGKGRLMSKAEMLGRLVCCGFEIVEHHSINGITWFAARKVKEPTFDKNPSYGPLFKMRRIGKGGRIFHVLKFRTMHPYSEYLHDYVLKLNGYAESGKPAADFRLTPWGKFMRRYWLDELPQLLNVLKGDMKLVGVRPVSPRYFEDIPKQLQELRITQKPGCIPPYVALDRKPSVDEVLKAEEEYLLEKIRKPFFTDMRYFFRALYNIVVKRKRSA